MPTAVAAPPVAAQPSPPVIVAQVPSAVAARKRKTTRRGQEQRIGSAILHAPPTALPPVVGAGKAPANITVGPQPPPPPGHNLGNVPQYTAPTYKPPNKALEYLALGLATLFGGSPIGSAATGALRGMGERSQREYQQAQDQAQTDFTNASNVYAAQQQQRQRGIDPNTGNPFVLPPQLQRVLPAGTKRAPTYDDYAGHYAALAAWYTQQGATGPAAEARDQATNYYKAAVDQANNARAYAVSLATQLGEDRREQARINTEWGIHTDTETQENARHADTEAREDARASALSPLKRAELGQQATKAYASWHGSYAKALRVPTGLDANSNPLPPAVSMGLAATIAPYFSRIDRANDPEAAAQHYADITLPKGTSPQTAETVKQLFLERGAAADLQRRSRGLPIFANNYAPIATPKTEATGTAPQAGPTPAPEASAPETAHQLEATSNGVPIYSDDGGKTWHKR